MTNDLKHIRDYTNAVGEWEGVIRIVALANYIKEKIDKVYEND